MDWLEFFANVIGSVIWPTVTLVIVFYLLEPLSNLIPLIRKLKYKEFELEFLENISESGLNTIKLEGSNNRTKILNAWKQLDEEIRKLLDKFNIVQDRGWNAHFDDMLTKESGLDEKTVKLIPALKEMRDRVLDREDFIPNSETTDAFLKISQKTAKKITEIYNK